MYSCAYSKGVNLGGGGMVGQAEPSLLKPTRYFVKLAR
jgi:hypothetical protein